MQQAIELAECILLSSLRCLRRCNTIKFEAYAKQWHEIYFGILPAKVTGQHKLVLRSRAVALRCVNSIKSVPRISVLRRAYRAAFEYDTAAKARDAKSLKIFYEVVAGHSICLSLHIERMGQRECEV